MARRLYGARSLLVVVVAGLTMAAGPRNLGNGAASAIPVVTRSDLRTSPLAESLIYSFHAFGDGALPQAGLLLASGGTFLGTTEQGQGGGVAGGTVYELVPSPSGYQERTLHYFGIGTDGKYPLAPLTAGPNGVLFGTTYGGGASGFGTVYQLVSSGQGYAETVIYSFLGGADGAEPFAFVIADASGTLYGTTSIGGGTGCGGGGCGTVYRLAPSGSGYTESILYSFRGGRDGANPDAGLLLGNHGMLFGTTHNGGPLNRGTVYALRPTGSTYREVILHTFARAGDGESPDSPLVLEGTGSLLGSTEFGGARGYGTVYALQPSARGHTERVLYSFLGGSDGALPVGRLAVDAHGAIYGVTERGGGTTCQSSPCGTVYELSPAGSGFAETVLYRFLGPPDGDLPMSGVTFGADGALYGTTFYGGAAPTCSLGCGTVFRVTLGG